MTGRKEVHIEEAMRKVKQDKIDLRDSFARAAVAGVSDLPNAKAIAAASYEIADAMMKQRLVKKKRAKPKARTVQARVPLSLGDVFKDMGLDQETLL